MYLFDVLVNNPMFMSGAFILNMFGGRMMFQDIQPFIHNKDILKIIFIFCLFLVSTKDMNLSIVLVIIYSIFIQVIKSFHKETNSEDDIKKKNVDTCIDLLTDVKKTL
jgi:hypothetical protein